MSFMGADTDALRGQAQLTGDGAGKLDELLSRLDGLVMGVQWLGPDADAFRDLWSSSARMQFQQSAQELRSRQSLLQGEANEQDTTSADDGGPGGGSGGGSLWDRFTQWLDDYEQLESNGFFGDLLGGPEAGYWGALKWNIDGAILDALAFIPDPTGATTILGLPMDIANIGMGLYDAAQAFQDGEFFGVVDGLTTAGINALDATFGVIGLIPTPPTKIIGEIGGMVTGALDMGWSGMTALAQASAIAGGPGGGSTSQFMLSMPGFLLEQATGYSGLSDLQDQGFAAIDSVFGSASDYVREQVPIIDPILDLPQRGLEAVSDAAFGDTLENAATRVNEGIRSLMPW